MRYLRAISLLSKSSRLQPVTVAGYRWRPSAAEAEVSQGTVFLIQDYLLN